MESLKSLYKLFSKKYQTVHFEYLTNFKPRYGHGLKPHGLLNEIIGKNDELYKTFLTNALKYSTDFEAIKECKNRENESDPCWNNNFLPGLDIITLFAMIAEYKPAKYVEVGSGNSTKVAALAKKKYSNNTKIVSIDPYPRVEIDSLSDDVIRVPFENYNYKPLLELEKNDILFIDNSHRVLPNSDATVFFMEILPYLKSGVIVHIHDIYLPYDYPQFMCDRVYNEQYMLASFIMANPDKYKTILPNFYISENKELHQILNPIWQLNVLKNVEQHGGSYWLQIQ